MKVIAQKFDNTKSLYRDLFWFVYFKILHKSELRSTGRFLSYISPYSYVPRFGKMVLERFTYLFWTEQYDDSRRVGPASRLKGLLGA